MSLENGTEFFSNKVILITGATGFLAKILVEKILRIQPNIKKLYLLVRAKDNMSPVNRLHHEILQKDLFRVLREEHGEKFDAYISEKVAPIEGDTTLPDLGLKNPNELAKEIDAIVHLAATTKFRERYDVAFGINTMGAMNVLNFAKMCSRLQVHIHVSTAYVCGERKGLIEETPCQTDKTPNGRRLDIDVERSLIDDTLYNLRSKAASLKEIRNTMASLAQQRANMYGWPNAYVMTKAMSEMLIWKHKEELPIVIIRPTMIIGTYKDPFPGWIEGNGSASTATIIYGKGLVSFTHADAESVYDMIPADMVVNCMIMAMMANANIPNLTIYQVGSSFGNPITFGSFMNLCFEYFNEIPWVDDRGLVAKIRAEKLVKSRALFLLLLAFLILKLLVAKLLYIGSGGRCLRVVQEKLETQFKVTYKVAQLFKPYICFMGIFDDRNTEKLREWMNKGGVDEKCFNFDPKSIDWADHLLKVEFPATVKYLF